MRCSVRTLCIELPAGIHRRTQNRNQVGEWLSLVEHLVRDQGVGGSNPLSPTKNLQ